MFKPISAGVAFAGVVGLAVAPLAPDQDVHAEAAVVAAELGTIAKHLQMCPEMVSENGIGRVVLDQEDRSASSAPLR